MKNVVMRALIIVYLLIVIQTSLLASHYIGGHIRVDRQFGYYHKIELSLYRDISGINAPNNPVVQVYKRQGGKLIEYILNKDSVKVIPEVISGCGVPLVTMEEHIYSLLVNLDPIFYSDSGGYIFYWETCCRNANVYNIKDPLGTSSSTMTFFPPVQKHGVAFLNSSPILKAPINDIAFNNFPYSLNFGGTDPDGDSLSYVLFTPISGNHDTSLANVTNLSYPYFDPSTLFDTIEWDSGFSINGMIPGTTMNTNLKVDEITGEVTMTPNTASPNLYLFGIWCREFRNGELIGSVFRDFEISIMNDLDSNKAPQAYVETLPIYSSWNNDTIEFINSSICVPIGIFDLDPFATIGLEIINSDYDSGYIFLLNDSVNLVNSDTFITGICFQPDSFVANTQKTQILSFNRGCIILQSDTLTLYTKFVGFSNAGWGGIFDFPSLNPSGTIALFPLLKNNPNTGGRWVDINNSGRIISNDTIDLTNLATPSTLEFYYIDRKGFFKADTAHLRLNFGYPNSLYEFGNNSIKIYPNPAKDVININSIEEGYSFEIFDFSGKKLKQVILNPEGTSIEISEFPQGLYFYQFQNQRGKFLIQR